MYIYNGKKGEKVPRDVINAHIRPGVKTIREEAFQDYKVLESVAIPSSVLFIEGPFIAVKALYPSLFRHLPYLLPMKLLHTVRVSCL